MNRQQLIDYLESIDDVLVHEESTVKGDAGDLLTYLRYNLRNLINELEAEEGLATIKN